MSEDSKPKGITRRKFLQGVGTGMIGSAVLPGILSGEKEKPGATPPPHPGKELVVLNVNGKQVRVMIEPRTTLAQLLRDHLELTGTKIVCDHGECGGCTVLLNNKAVYSCQMLAVDAAGGEVLTIEGLLTGEELHPIQQAFIDHDGLQCGFCTPGQVLAAKALLLKHPKPTSEQVREGMSGNLCRCAAYPNIIKSVMAAAEKQ